jgi:hypothetical protein
MLAPADESTFTVQPIRVPDADAENARWSVYLIRVDLEQFQAGPALKIGMVGTSTVKERLARHKTEFGEPTLLAVWSLEGAVAVLEPAHRWRVVEQYEARLQFAADFVLPAARLRLLRPGTRVYSYEWFEDNPIVIDAVERYALWPVTLPHGWTLADTTEPTERSEEEPSRTVSGLSPPGDADNPPQ